MKGKTPWQSVSSGPDWTDIEAMMRSIEAVHGGKCGLLLSPDGIGSTGGYRVDLLLEQDMLPSTGAPGAIGIEQRWPCREHRTLEACVFAGLYRLDFAVAEAYKQSSFLDA